MEQDEQKKGSSLEEGAGNGQKVQNQSGQRLRPSHSSAVGGTDAPCVGNTASAGDAGSSTSSSSGQTFDKRKEIGASLAGSMFEVKMLVVYYLRLVNDEMIRDFHLATNVRDLNPLDDAIVTYTTNSDPTKIKTIFIQFKHKLRETLLPSSFTSKYGFLYLPTYFEKYNFIEDKFKSKRDESVLFNGSFEHCQFIIFTTAPEGKMFGKFSRRDQSSKVDHILKTESKSKVHRRENSFIFNKEYDSNIFELICDPRWKAFLKVLRVISGQKLESDLDELVKKELRKTLAYRYTKPEIEFIYLFLLENIKHWWSCSDTLITLHDSTILDKSVNQFIISKLSLLEGNTFGLKFTSENLFHKDALVKHNLVHIISSKGSTKLSCTKLVQSLDAFNIGSYTVLRISVDTLVNETERVISACVSADKDILVIVSEDTDDDDAASNTVVYQHLQQFHVMNNFTKKLVLVSVKDDPFVLKLKQTLLEKCKTKDLADAFMLKQLEKECKKRITEREVFYQGESMTLGKILVDGGDSVEDLFDDDFVRQILAPGIITLGSPLDQDESYYIGRTLERADVLKKTVFGKDSDDVFVVRGITKEQLKELVPSREKVAAVDDDVECRFLVVEPDTNDLSKVLDRKENVHEVRMCPDERLRWISTKGSNVLIKKFIKHGCPTPYRPNTALDLDGRVILLIAEPGMGKTTFVTHLASETKKIHPDYLIIRVNLRQHMDLLEHMCDDDDHAYGFLYSLFGIGRSVNDKPLFRFLVNNSRKCVIFLDGFDEIAPKYTEKVLSLISSMLNTGAGKIYITSRHEMKEALESKLMTRTFTVSKFNADDQKMFFEKFWGRHNNKSVGTNETKLLVDTVLKLINDAGKDFMGIALHTQMLAEIYEGYYEGNATVAELPEKVNILTMFEMVVDKKYDIYIRRRFPDDQNVDNEIKKLKKLCIKEHMHASLEFLLSETKTGSLYNGKCILEENKAFYEEVKNCDIKTGIVEVLNDKPVFLHQTYAEYFAALWFSENFEHNRQFLRDNLFTIEFNVIRRQFDLMLTKESSFLTAVVDNDLQAVRSLLEPDGGDYVDVTDLGGRSALHLAVTADTFRHDQLIGPPCQSMIQLLLEYKIDGFTEDKLTIWNPLVYAFNSNAWQALEHLLFNDKPVEENMILLQGHISNKLILKHRKSDVSMSTLIHTAAAHGHVKIIELLGKVSFENIFAQDELDRTPLHVACKRGELRVVRTLVQIVEDEKITRGDLDHLQTRPEKLNSTKDIVRAYLNTPESYHRTALHVAAEHGFVDIVSLLVSKGANVTAIDVADSTALHYACERGNEYVARALIGALGDDAEMVASYVNTVNAREDHNEWHWSGEGLSALQVASRGGHSSLVHYLVTRGGDVWAEGEEGGTLLHDACKRGDVDTVKTLTLVDRFEGEWEAVDYLKTKDDEWGRTARDVALNECNGDIVKLLDELFKRWSDWL